MTEQERWERVEERLVYMVKFISAFDAWHDFVDQPENGETVLTQYTEKAMGLYEAMLDARKMINATG